MVFISSAENILAEDKAQFYESEFFIGLAELYYGSNSIEGNIELIEESDNFVKKVDMGRMTFYLKGRIKGKYLLTAWFDTGEEKIVLDKLDAVKKYSDWWNIVKEHNTIARRLAEKIVKRSEWKDIRRKTIVPAIREYVEGKISENKGELGNKLLHLFRESFRIGDKPYVYLAKVDKHERIPSIEEFKEISKNISIEYDYVDSTDFTIRISVINKDDGNKLMTFDIKFRWKNSQMVSGFSTSTTKPNIVKGSEGTITEKLFPRKFAGKLFPRENFFEN